MNADQATVKAPNTKKTACRDGQQDVSLQGSRGLDLPWCNTLHVAHRISQDSSNDAGDDIPHEPGPVAEWLLRTLIPHCHDDSEAWSYGSFGGTEEEPDGQESMGIGTGCGQHQDSAPDESLDDQQVVR